MTSSDEDERKALRRLLRQIERPNASLLASNWPVFGVWLLFSGAFMYLFQTGDGSPLHRCCWRWARPAWACSVRGSCSVRCGHGSGRMCANTSMWTACARGWQNWTTERCARVAVSARWAARRTKSMRDDQRLVAPWLPAWRAWLDSIARAHAIGIAAELRLQRAYRPPRRADRPQRCSILDVAVVRVRPAAMIGSPHCL